jgi:hypothetical protein
VTTVRLELTREQILAFRRRVSALDERLPLNNESLRTAAWAGLQDSMPRAALLSIHARVRGATPDSWEHPSLVGIWGPRYSTYVVPAVDRAVFTLSRMPDDPKGKQRAEQVAKVLRNLLGSRKSGHHDVGEALGVNPNSLRYGAVTGEIVIRWAGALQPQIWMLPRPDVSPEDARLEMARRYLHVFGPASATGFAEWAGISTRAGLATFEALHPELIPVKTPIGDAFLLASDEPAILASPLAPAPARLLPSGDTYFLLQGIDRELLVPDPGRRSELWTSRVWPGALLVAGEIVGVWRRAGEVVTADTWRRLNAAERRAVGDEAASLPLPALKRPIVVRWTD